MTTVEILGQHVQITHLLAAFLCVVFGVALLFTGKTRQEGAADGDSTDAHNNNNNHNNNKKKRRKRNRKKKKKKQQPEPEPEPEPASASEVESSSDDDEDSSYGYSDEDVEPQPPAAPAPAPKNKKNKNKNKNNKGKGKSAQAAAKKGSQQQKSAGSFKPPKGYNPTPEDTRKRREREDKRRAKQAAGAGAGAATSAKPARANPAAAQAGKITKRGIIGLSRAMTKEDRGGNWEKVGGDKKKKNKSKGATTMATTNDPHARVIVVPTSKIGMIIGSGGLTLRKIEAETGCSVSMPQVAADAKPTANTRVTIRGDDEDMLREAVACVADLVNRGHSDLLYRGTDSKQSVFRLNSALHHILVGKGGATIRAIQDKSKCKVVLPSDKGSSKITIIGEPEGIKIVQEALKQIDRYCYCKLADPSLTHEEVEVSDSELGYIIGFKGHVIKSIQGDTNTKIYTPGKGRKNTNVIVVGTAANVNRAVKQIHRNIEKNTY